MNLLGAKTRRYSRRERGVLRIGLVVLLLSLLSQGALTTHAAASFPGRNARILVTLETPLEPSGETDPYGSDFNLFSISPTGAGIQQVTEGPWADFEPTWSPDGDKVLFARSPIYGPNSDIFLIDAEGNEVNLTNTPLDDEADPMWSPDGTKIIFASTNDVEANDLYVMNADGSDRVQLSMPGDQNSPAWSPDGKWIAYRHNGGSNSNQLQIRLFKPDGSGDHPLIDGSRVQGRTPVEPNWSPDGKWIAFCAIYTDSAMQGDLFLIRPNGTALTELPDTGNENDPVWSPDGKQIAFVSNGDGAAGNAGDGEYSVYKMNVDGSHIVRLLDISLDPFYTDLDWGPRP